jgi:hypothetical protein
VLGRDDDFAFDHPNASGAWSSYCRPAGQTVQQHGILGGLLDDFETAVYRTTTENTSHG